jgi:hypothetical protein
MTIPEIYNRVLVDSGFHQFTLEQVEAYIMTTINFTALVRTALSYINDYNPKVVHNTVLIANGRYIYASAIPEEIQEAIPITIFSRLNRMAFFALVMSPELSQMGSDLNYNKYAVGGSTLDYKVPVPHIYNKPTLYVFYDGDVATKEIHYYSITPTVDDATINEVVDMTHSNGEFFKLLKGLFYQSIGRARRQFIIKESPVVLDADLMVTEGKAIEDEAIAKLEEKSHWWNAIR